MDDSTGSSDDGEFNAPSPTYTEPTYFYSSNPYIYTPGTDYSYGLPPIRRTSTEDAREDVGPEAGVASRSEHLAVDDSSSDHSLYNYDFGYHDTASELERLNVDDLSSDDDFDDYDPAVYERYGSHSARRTDTEGAQEDIDSEADVVSGKEGEVKLCFACRAMIMSKPCEDNSYKYEEYSTRRNPTHQKSARKLDAAARHGCKFCKIIAERIWWQTGGIMPVEEGESGYSRSPWVSDDDDFTWYTFTENKRNRTVYSLSVFVEHNVFTPQGERGCFLKLKLEPEEGNEYPPAAIVTEDTGSDRCWQQAIAWHKDCIENHQQCQGDQSIKQSWYPTRLIDVGTSADSEVKLCVTGESDPKGRYVTLSHRWGIGEMLRLTLKDLGQYRSGISIAALPQTFADAVQVTRRLRVRYIWIDSLCIIQDSAADWLAESVQMQNVYMHSLLNISAAGPGDSSGSGSLFRRRKADADWPWWTTEAYGGKRQLIYDSEFWGDELASAELNRRAWVLQERMLAPRIIHFGKSQLFWECHARQACESFPGGIPRSLTNCIGKSLDPSEYYKRSRAVHDWSSWKRREDDSINCSYDIWSELVTQYSACGITKPSDKLVAISGLAMQVSSMVCDYYIAGLWRSKLVQGLAWHVSPICEKARRVYTYRAPSWSWAAVDSEVWFEDMDSVPRVTVEQLSITPVQPGNNFGQIRAAFVKLRGYLAGPVKVVSHSREHVVLKFPKPGSKDDSPSIDLDTPMMQGSGFYFMPILASPPHWTSVFRTCLLLRQFIEEGQQVYRRCGTVGFTGENLTIVESTVEGARHREQLGLSYGKETIMII